ncbi:circadian clock protein KaiC [Sphaerisporangium album]|uniref:non-specific serine/threonine protein kinase n=1 Tax=Sphaerisporangium album TaxID=509200 RepID=A0A367FRH8_9ACTN|nr:circadian clock protein KaiC [Sphaerisporangium album]RCG32442.1 circadian clock protein KaiC [Sphaerisporangium album]
MTGGDAIKRVPTGINGFDQIALGGLPACRSTLVSGTTGSGKTLFAVEFLARGITTFDEPGVFVTFEETSADIRRNSASLGFTIDRWEGAGKWAFVDVSASLGEEESAVGAYDFGALLSRVGHAVRRTGARRVAVDSLGSIFLRFADVGIVRHELARIAGALEELGVTSVVTAERPEEYDGVTRYGVEEFVFDNVMILRNVLRRQRRSRTIEIVKFRGAQHRTGEWVFTIDGREGIVVVPIAFLASRETASSARVSSGNAELDRMCGGGFFRDGIVLVSGPSGAGKTLTGLAFTAAGVAAGERCLHWSFDETREQLVRNAGGWNLDLAAMEASGLLRIVSGYPEAASLEDHFLEIRRAVEEFAPARLVVDPLSALERVASPKALLDFVLALTAILRRREITTLYVSAPGGRFTPVDPPVIAGLVDISIMFRYTERDDEIRRAIAVLQSRGSAHDHRIRDVTIDGTGMHIGEGMRNGTPDGAK